jgi:hypothetical protein
MRATTSPHTSTPRGSARPRTGPDAARWPSLLAASPDVGLPPSSPLTLADLHLTEVIDAMAPGDPQRELWRRPPTDVATVRYRQDVVADLGGADLRGPAESFSTAIGAARAAIIARRESHYAMPAQLNLLEAIRRFVGEVRGFCAVLAGAEPRSQGLRGVARRLADHVAGEAFGALSRGCGELVAELRTPTVHLGVRAGTVWVDEDDDRLPWADQVAAFFARFDAPATEPTPIPQRPRRYLNHVEAQALGLVAGLRPAVFARLGAFVAAHEDFLPPELERLGEELRFYLGFLRVADRLAADGVAWCRPTMRDAPGQGLRLEGFVDLALALRHPGQPLVANDVQLSGTERLAFITGPNQGGKTTFARAIGQCAHLASLGLPVPARAAALPLLNPVLTHFPQPDDPEHQRGGLAEEMARLHTVLERADGSSLLVLNELFSSTSAEDARELSELVLPRFRASGCRVLWVTFLEELAGSVDGAASLVGQVAVDDPTRPTFRFRRQAPAGRSHAAALAARHGLGRDDLARRLS